MNRIQQARRSKLLQQEATPDTSYDGFLLREPTSPIDYTGVRGYDEDEPFISLEDCAKLKRIYQHTNPPLKNGWRSARNPTRMPTDEDTTPYTSFIGALASIKTDIINLIVGEGEVLLIRKHTLNYALYCKKILYPFDMMMSDLLEKIPTTNNWIIDPLED